GAGGGRSGVAYQRRPVMDASNLKPGMPMENILSLRREDENAQTTPAATPADVVSIIDNLVHADDLAGRAVDAIGRGDLARAIGDVEWSLKVHVQAAIRSAQLADAAERRGEHADSPALRSQGALLFWHLPGRARIAATLLRAAVAGTDAPDPAESLRFIAEG